MPWNYRVFHTCYAPPDGAKTIHYYSVRETYYTDARRVHAIGGEASRASGATLDELRQDLARMQEACARPVLTPLEVPGYRYGDGEIPPPVAEAPHVSNQEGVT